MGNTENKSKELVSLRQRPMKNGGYTLYLDYYARGRRHREFLKMYLLPETNMAAKHQNAETLRDAEIIKTRRTIEIQEGLAGIKPRNREVVPILDYMLSLEKKYESRGQEQSARTMHKVAQWLRRYKGNVPIASIDKEYVEGFSKFLSEAPRKVCKSKPSKKKEKPLSKGTAVVYFAALNNVLNRAYKAGLIEENPVTRVETEDRPKRVSAHREYLTLEEVQRLAATPCASEPLKSAFLFACFTGLRISDILHLRWEDIRKTDKGWQIEMIQKKTKEPVYAPVSNNAYAQLPSTEVREGLVYDLPEHSQRKRILDEWVADAGIDKHISFHCSRHTCATLLLTYGANLYTVSSILGHTSIKSTQIYAKVVDETKRKAVDCIPDLSK